MKIFTSFVTFTIILSLVFSIFYENTLTIFINGVFLISIITFIYSGFRLLYEKGAFSFSRYAIKRVVSIVFNRPNKDDIEKKEVKLEDYLKTSKFKSTVPLFYGSLLMLLLSIIIGFLII